MIIVEIRFFFVFLLRLFEAVIEEINSHLNSFTWYDLKKKKRGNIMSVILGAEGKREKSIMWLIADTRWKSVNSYSFKIIVAVLHFGFGP